jgi:hypothetical protein
VGTVAGSNSQFYGMGRTCPQKPVLRSLSSEACPQKPVLRSLSSEACPQKPVLRSLSSDRDKMTIHRILRRHASAVTIARDQPTSQGTIQVTILALLLRLHVIQPTLLDLLAVVQQSSKIPLARASTIPPRLLPSNPRRCCQTIML